MAPDPHDFRARLTWIAIAMPAATRPAELSLVARCLGGLIEARILIEFDGDQSRIHMFAERPGGLSADAFREEVKRALREVTGEPRPGQRPRRGARGAVR
ncbi:MAG: hypothetical protein ACK41C_02770 [Phenylobacterium sp.]|uniref:hypothetical protein n=1 Tax=Phenylobacterium sp. TaxID=1871053 RepID=UPI00391B708E